jgi:hypothetical protein
MVKRLRWHNNLIDQINLLLYTVRGIKTSRGKNNNVAYKADG